MREKSKSKSHDSATTNKDYRQNALFLVLLKFNLISFVPSTLVNKMPIILSRQTTCARNINIIKKMCAQSVNAKCGQ